MIKVNVEACNCEQTNYSLLKGISIKGNNYVICLQCSECGTVWIKEVSLEEEADET